MIGTLESFIERGLIVHRADGFKLCAPLADLKVEISANLNQVLESRLAQLNDREQRALVAGSVVGMSFEAATYYQRSIDRAQKRYLAAIKALALVRRLALPVLVQQINVASRQRVSVTG